MFLTQCVALKDWELDRQMGRGQTDEEDSKLPASFLPFWDKSLASQNKDPVGFFLPAVSPTPPADQPNKFRAVAGQICSRAVSLSASPSLFQLTSPKLKEKNLSKSQ